ncbi:hypothetical protein DOY81_013605 [Sarcophaga bullata]|nr:hypothetical protein DOY81_013605 [Sarcophaga bullata]
MVSARLTILIVGIFCGTALSQPTSRILGGEEASKNDFPYACSIRVDGAHICGGSIISNNKILTAAHCAFEKWQKNFSKSYCRTCRKYKSIFWRKTSFDIGYLNSS